MTRQSRFNQHKNMTHNFSWNPTKHDKANSLFSQLLSGGTLKSG